jgi:hypothetical protein
MLQQAGFSKRDAEHALRTLASYVVGYALLERGNPNHRSFDRGLEMLLDCLREQAGG